MGRPWTLVDIFPFTDYRRFLEAAYRASKAEDKKYSYQFFSKRAGFSAAHLKLIITGDRNLTRRGVEGYTKSFDLTGNRAKYFEALVEHNQASTDRQRSEAMSRAVGLRPKTEAFLMDKHYCRYLLDPIYATLYSFMALPGFQSDLEWIGRQLIPAVSASEVRRGLEFLEVLGHVSHDGQGRWVPKEEQPVLTANAEVQKTFLRDYHRSMLELGKDSMANVPQERRHLVGFTIRLSKAKFEEFRAQVNELFDRFEAQAHEDEQPTAVYQVGAQLFPLALIEEDPE